MYNKGSEEKNLEMYWRDLPVRRYLQSGKVNTNFFIGRLNKHYEGTHEFNQYVQKFADKGKFGPSRLTISPAEGRELLTCYIGTGYYLFTKEGWTGDELITQHNKKVGIAVNEHTGKEADTTVFLIKYSKKGVHLVPTYPSKKGRKKR